MWSAQHLIELCLRQLANIIDIQSSVLKYCRTSDSTVFIGITFIVQRGNNSEMQMFLRFGGFGHNFPKCWCLYERWWSSLWHSAGNLYTSAYLQLYPLPNMAIQAWLGSAALPSQQPVLLSSEGKVTAQNTSKSIWSELPVVHMAQAGKPVLNIKGIHTVNRLPLKIQQLQSVPQVWSAAIKQLIALQQTGGCPDSHTHDKSITFSLSWQETHIFTPAGKCTKTTLYQSITQRSSDILLNPYS